MSSKSRRAGSGLADFSGNTADLSASGHVARLSDARPPQTAVVLVERRLRSPEKRSAQRQDPFSREMHDGVAPACKTVSSILDQGNSGPDPVLVLY